MSTGCGKKEIRPVVVASSAADVGVAVYGALMSSQPVEQLTFIGCSPVDVAAVDDTPSVVQTDAPTVTPADEPDEPRVEVRRSARRRRTVSAYRDGDRTVVLIPARMSKAEEAQWVTAMLEQLAARERKARPGDDELMARAEQLSRRHLGGKATPASVRWVSNQRERWGSCTPVDGTIRLSDRLLGAPSWVVDYVLLHELAHLIEPGHGPRFWALVADFPRTERARGYLEGFTAAGG
jgi:predicted metal-dependent hydrolase